MGIVDTALGEYSKRSIVDMALDTKEVMDRPTWVKVADFMTGHFPEQKDIPEVQVTGDNAKINVPETAAVPLLQSPEMALGGGILGAFKATGGIVSRALRGLEETAAYMTGGGTDVAKGVTKLATKGVSGVKRMVAKEISSLENIKPETLESMVKGGKIADLPKYAEGSSINLERLDTTQDVLQFQNALTTAAEETIGKHKVSWDETVKAAEDLAWDQKAFLKKAKTQGGFSAAEIQAARQINANALHDLFNTVRDMPADPALRNDAMRLGVLDKINNYVEIMKATSQKSSEAGRALNIHKKMVSDNPEFAQDAYRSKMFQDIFDKIGGRDITDKMIDDLAKVDINDPQAIRVLVQKYHQSTISDKFYEAWLNSILSAPTTHFANILGNLLTMATKIPESAVSNLLKGKSPLGEMRAESFGMLQGIKDGVRSAVKAFQTGVPSDMFMKTESKHLNAIPGKTGEIIRIPTRSLTAADEFFKSIVYRSELNRKSYIIAEKQGLEGRALGDRMSEIMNDPYHESFKAVHDAAHEESLYRTFNKPLGEFGNSAMKLRDRVPALKYIIPFIRTPVNIAKFSLERTPFNFGKIAYDYKTGKISRDMLSQELSKPIVGSMLSAATTIAVLEGNITGGPPKNKKERDLLYASGWQPYSIKIGDTYYSYNRLEPLGSIMGMTADFVNSSKSDAEINEKAGQIMLSMSRNIASKTFLSGVSNTLDAISDPERYAGNFIERMAGSLVPSVVASASRAYDPYIRDVQTPFEAIQARIPYYSTKLPYKPGAKIGGYELPAMKQGNGLNRFLSPVAISETRKDTMGEAIKAGLEMNKIELLSTKQKKKYKDEVMRGLRNTE